MMKIPLLIVPAVAFVLIGAVTGHNPYPIYAQISGQQGNSSDFSVEGTIATRIGNFTATGPVRVYDKRNESV